MPFLKFFLFFSYGFSFCWNPSCSAAIKDILVSESALEHAEGSNTVRTLKRTPQTVPCILPCLFAHGIKTCCVWISTRSREDAGMKSPWSQTLPQQLRAAKKIRSAKCFPREMHKDQLNHAKSLHDRHTVCCLLWFGLHNEFWWALTRLPHWLKTNLTTNFTEHMREEWNLFSQQKHSNVDLARAATCKILCLLNPSCAW